MTQLPPEDQSLIDFLRQHHASPPPPAPDLEQRLMAAVQVTPQASRTEHRGSGRSRWIIPSAIAAAVVAAVAAHRLLMPGMPTAAEVSSLETFMETSWQDSVAQEPDFDPVNQTIEE